MILLILRAGWSIRVVWSRIPRPKVCFTFPEFHWYSPSRNKRYCRWFIGCEVTFSLFHVSHFQSISRSCIYIQFSRIRSITFKIGLKLKCKILIILVTNLWSVYLLPANLKSLRFSWKHGNEAPPLSNCYNVFIYSYYMCDF